MLEKRLQGQKKGGSWRWSELPEPRFLLAGLSGWCCYCSTAGVRTNEIRRLTEWWHARTLASYYKSGWSNELIFFLPLKYYKFLSFDSTYLFIFFINLHALYLIMKKKSLPLILLVAVRTRPDILDGMRKLWFILTTCPQQCSSGWKSLAEERRKKLWKRGFLHDSVFLFSIFI